jgi:hypothetical protein
MFHVLLLLAHQFPLPCRIKLPKQYGAKFLAGAAFLASTVLKVKKKVKIYFSDVCMTPAAMKDVTFDFSERGEEFPAT